MSPPTRRSRGGDPDFDKNPCTIAATTTRTDHSADRRRWCVHGADVWPCLDDEDHAQALAEAADEYGDLQAPAGDDVADLFASTLRVEAKLHGVLFDPTTGVGFVCPRTSCSESCWDGEPACANEVLTRVTSRLRRRHRVVSEAFDRFDRIVEKRKTPRDRWAERERHRAMLFRWLVFAVERARSRSDLTEEKRELIAQFDADRRTYGMDASYAAVPKAQRERLDLRGNVCTSDERFALVFRAETGYRPAARTVSEWLEFCAKAVA